MSCWELPEQELEDKDYTSSLEEARMDLGIKRGISSSLLARQDIDIGTWSSTTAMLRQPRKHPVSLP